MPIPSNLETCIVKGKYLDFEGAPAVGAVILKFPVFVRDPGADTILVPFDIVAPLDSAGAFSKTIPVNNDPDADPVGWELTVKEDFPGGRTYSFPVPAGSATLDLADIANTSPVPDPGDTVYATFPALSAEIANRQQADLELEDELRAYIDTQDDLLVPESSRNMPNGFAGLDVNGDVLGAVIPDSMGGHKTFTDGASSGVAPTVAAHLTRKDYVDGLDAANVKLTGAQTVAGVKTFSSIPVLPATSPTLSEQATRKAYVDDLDAANVKLTGAQSISGSKTFTTSVLVERAAATDIGFRGQVTGDAVLRSVLRVDGRLEVGDGALSRDTFMERTSAGVWLATSQVRVSGVAPSNVADLTRKDYVDAGDATAVKLTGAQSVAGLKTFTNGIAGTTLRLTSTDDASLTSTTHAFQIGADASSNMRIDNNEIRTQVNGVVDSLFIQPDGGNVSLFFTRSVGSTTDKLEVKGKVESSTNRTLMDWTLISTLGTFNTGFSADPSNPPMMGKFVENGIEVWRYKGRFAVTSGTMTPDSAFTAFTFTNTSERPGAERGFSSFGSNSQFFPVRVGLSSGGVLSVGVPTESANTVTGFSFDWSIVDPMLTDVT